ncbi:hypothetical protein J1N35_003830 [Gossypium stocksii]|uniref:RNase H type-1 domain-containing protein n=1 Tax=Gossypium stocksii TaxID=47602 RepID=A0A9D3WCD6_9ROSI|nr:hypothetical protein J1N35_003830 [Gossypium stocksii]
MTIRLNSETVIERMNSKLFIDLHMHGEGNFRNGFDGDFNNASCWISFVAALDAFSIQSLPSTCLFPVSHLPLFGVLRDSNGVARALFLGPVAAKNSIIAEVGAIIIALDVYLAMGWKGKSSLIIEIGSNEVFSWFKNNRLRLWLLQSIFKDIENKMVRVSNVSFSKAEKHGNEMAYALALAGIKRP